MTQRFTIHPTHPQARLLRQAADVVRDGGLVALPTDACYVLACHLSDRHAADRLRGVPQPANNLCPPGRCRAGGGPAPSARADNRQYRFLKEWTPGAYTFVLNATREVPRRLSHPSRKTIGLRVPASPVAQGLLEALGEPLLCTTLILPDDEDPQHEADEIIRLLNKRIELVLDAGGQGYVPTTVIDLTSGEPVVQRVGCGPVTGMVTAG